MLSNNFDDMEVVRLTVIMILLEKDEEINFSYDPVVQIQELSKNYCREGIIGYPLGYTNIVLALYSLLTLPSITGNLLFKIYDILEKCWNHNYFEFIKLVNEKHSPHVEVRNWALGILGAINRDSGNVPPGMQRWKKGAVRVVDWFFDKQE